MMRINQKFVQARIDVVNRNLGFDPDAVDRRTIGAFVLYRDACGARLHRIENEHGGVSTAGDTGTLRDVATFLGGMIAAQRIARGDRV